MTEAEWLSSNDAGAMLEVLWQSRGIQPCEIDLRFGGHVRESEAAQSAVAGLDRQLHRFYLASCHAIWKLLPQETSRRGVELAEQYLTGKARTEELNKFNRDVEGAAFNIDYNVDPEAIRRWVEEVRAIPETELQSVLHPPGIALEIEPRELLKRAAYFVDFAMIYPSLTPKGPPPKSYYPFLSADLLREFIGNPFHPARDSRQQG
ncbi:MAG TPA: hypothetical protein VKI65_17080 [Gemmataceae bacterium]|nr:hypothetical protein [Gemmataceae bacterium]